jgi:hypothetical protein
MAVPIDGTLVEPMEVGTWRTDAGDLHILVGIPRDGRWNLARYEQLHENAVLLEIGDSTALVASLKDIVCPKEIADAGPTARRYRNCAV